jgi:hypothetical protein
MKMYMSAALVEVICLVDSDHPLALHCSPSDLRHIWLALPSYREARGCQATNKHAIWEGIDFRFFLTCYFFFFLSALLECHLPTHTVNIRHRLIHTTKVEVTHMGPKDIINQSMCELRITNS